MFNIGTNVLRLDGGALSSCSDLLQTRYTLLHNPTLGKPLSASVGA